MKKIFLLLLTLNFSAFAEVFMLPQSPDILYDSTYPLNEYLIYDKENECVLHYLSKEKIPNGYVLQVKNKSDANACLKRGFSNVFLFDEQKKVVASWNGYFLDGFFIAGLPLNAKILKRTADENGTQYLHYLIDEDKDLKVRYIGTMHSFLDESGKYETFDACHPFELTIQTNNRMLFKNPDTFKNLLTVVQNYAQMLCPQSNNILLKATDSPSLEQNGIFFEQHFAKNGISFFEQNSKTDSQSPENKETKKRSSKKQKPTIDAAKQLLEMSKTSDVPVIGDFIVYVSNRTKSDVVFIEKPFIMKNIGNRFKLKEGWYHITANIAPMDDFEKKRTGLSLNETAAIINIQRATSCQKAFCLDD